MRKAYEQADWDKIRAEVLQRMGPWKEIRTRPALDETLERLTEVTASAVENHTPSAGSRQTLKPDRPRSRTSEMARELCGI